jgi:hypothetical protein
MAFDIDMIAAYQSAAERVEDPSQLVDLEQGHRHQVDELTACVSMIGGQPRSMGDAKMLRTQAKVIFAGLLGNRRVLAAMRSNANESVHRYEDAVKTWSGRAPPRIERALQAGLDGSRARLHVLERALAHQR